MARYTNEDMISLCDRITSICNRLHKRLDAIEEPQPPTEAYGQPPYAGFDSSIQQPRQQGYMEWRQLPPQQSWELRPPDPRLPYGAPQYRSEVYLPLTPCHQQGDQDWQPSLHPITRPYEQPHLSSHPSYTGPDQYAQPQYSADGYHPWKLEYQPSQPIPPPPPPKHCPSAALLPTIAPPPPLPVTAPSLASNLQQRAVVPVSMEKVNSDLGPNLFYPESLTSLNISTKKICFAVNEFDEKVTNSKRDGERFSSCGEIKTLHEISECVELDRDDYSSSCFGERRLPKNSHNFVDKSISDGDGEGASFNSSCDSVLDADDRLIPPRTGTADRSLDSTVRSPHMAPLLEQLQSEPVDKIKERSCHEQPIVVRQPLLRPTSSCCSALTPMAAAAVPCPPFYSRPDVFVTDKDRIVEEVPRNIVVPIGADVASIDRRSTTLDTDGRLIPPRKVMSYPIVYCHKCLLNKYDEKVESFANLSVARVRGEECSSREKVDHNELLRAHCFTFGTLEELVNHSPPIGGFGFSKEDISFCITLTLVQSEIMVMEKLKIGRAWSEVLDAELDVGTGAMFRQKLVDRSACAGLQLISAGKSVDHHDTSTEGEFLTEEERNDSLSRQLRTAATTLATRHADGSLPVQDINLELANQNGHTVHRQSEAGQRAIMTGLRADRTGLMKREKYRDALINMVWCYLRLCDISWVSVAGIRLERAKEGVERAHGKESARAFDPGILFIASWFPP